MSGFSGRLHSEEVVAAPDGSKFRVRVQRTGVPRYSTARNNVVGVAVGWLRYLRREQRTWSVVVNLTGIVRYEEVWDEDFTDRPSAARRAEDLAQAITQGTAPWQLSQ